MKKATKPAPSTTQNLVDPTQRDIGSLELYEKNLNFFKKKFPQLAQAFEKITPKAKLVSSDEDDYNIETDGHLLYKNGAKKDAELQVKQFLRQPTRILFAAPQKLFDEVDGKIGVNKDLETHQFKTRQYDDINSDHHAEEFMRETLVHLELKGLTPEKKVTKRDEPYYLMVYGSGLGFHLPKLASEFKPKNIVILDNDPTNFILSWRVFDWETFWLEQESLGRFIKMIIEEDAVLLLQKLNGAVVGDCIIGLDGIISYPHSLTPTLQLVFAEFNSPKTANLASFVGFIADEYNMMKNSFRNLRTGKHRILSTVRSKAEHLPVLIVGSGPSLEENIEWVKEVREKVILISSGSSMSVLLKNGITPDFQCVLERAKAVYDRHLEASKDFNLKQTYAVLTSTIWPGIDEFFRDSIYFFRPALSPLAVFASDAAQILNGEGPQVTNTAFAFAKRLQFKEYYLLGIDLGAEDPSRPRAERAWISPGIKQRELTIPVRGNRGKTVFTDKSLIQQRLTIEQQIRDPKMKNKVFNLGSGVRILGAISKKPSDCTFNRLNADHREEVKKLAEQFPVYSRERFISAWESGGVREEIAEYSKAMIKALDSAQYWDADLMKKIDTINSYLNKHQRKQYAPRLFRGTVLRIAMYMNSIFLRVQQGKEEATFNYLKEEFKKLILRITQEAYSLADELEQEDEHFSLSSVE